MNHTKDILRAYVFRLALERLEAPLDELEEVTGSGKSPVTAAPGSDPR